MGWRVIPIEPGGKRPLLSEWPKRATNDPEEIRRWIAEYPDANLGVATGEASGFFVLDVDPKNGGDKTLEALEAEHGVLPKTVQAATPSGGAHYLFKLPGFPVTNKAGNPGRGLDIRGNGGQIVVAPSVTVGPYRWVNAPWDTPVAEAPAWLLIAIRTRVESATGPVGDRGYFPKASEAVLEQARAALEEHGPAIDGDGGGLHTVHAAAIVTHDFALDDDEAWKLLVEWNETCQPPWELEGENSLRTMLGRGRKYGKAEYGCRRSLDVIEACRKLIADWQTAGAREENVFEMVVRARKLVAIGGDPVKRGIMLRELKAATGLKDKDLDLPKVRAYTGGGKRPGQIEVTTRLHEVADQSIAAIHDHVFQRNGVLCEVVTVPPLTFVADLAQARIQDLMSQCATYVRADEKGLVTQAAPAPVATILHARRTHPVRVLDAVTTVPVFLADGSILQDRGYNEQSRVFLEPAVDVSVPENPTKDDARKAVLVFKDLLCDFHFQGPEDFSSWLAALLTPLVKAATRNAPAPLFCVSASSPGAGKTLLTDVIAAIVMGGKAEVRPYNPKDPAEWGKRLTAFVKAASPVSVFDNVNGPIGDEALDRLITSSVLSDRILGASEAPPLPNVTTWMATGNNIEPHGDTVRRVLFVRTVVDTERPQERTGFKRALLEDYTLEHRAELLGAALTILRAYHVANRPDMSLASWGSFTRWSALVRGSLVWTGLPDPFLTQRRATVELNEGETDAHDFWIARVEESDGSPGSIVALANAKDAREILGTREEITVFHLRRFLGRFVDKPRLGKRIRRDRDAAKGQTTYYIERI